jgi:hypothetical protein
MEYCDLQSFIMQCHRVGPCPVSSTRPRPLSAFCRNRTTRIGCEEWYWKSILGNSGRADEVFISVCSCAPAPEHTVTYISYYASPWPIGQLLYFPWNVTYYSGNHSKAGLFSFTDVLKQFNLSSTLIQGASCFWPFFLRYVIPCCY